MTCGFLSVRTLLIVFLYAIGPFSTKAGDGFAFQKLSSCGWEIDFSDNGSYLAIAAGSFLTAALVVFWHMVVPPWRYPSYRQKVY